MLTLYHPVWMLHVKPHKNEYLDPFSLNHSLWLMTVPLLVHLNISVINFFFFNHYYGIFVSFSISHLHTNKVGCNSKALWPSSVLSVKC